MTPENIYLYLFLVGVFFVGGNFIISGLGRLAGGIGDALHGGNASGGELGDSSGGSEAADGGSDAGFEGGGETIDGGAEIHGGVSVDGHSDSGSGDLDDIADLHALRRGYAHGDVHGDGHHIDTRDGAHHGAGHGGASLLSVLFNWLPLRPTALICFATVTGGIGSICVRLGWLNIFTHILSISVGYVLSMLIGVLLPKKLFRAQNTSAAERTELIGVRAHVTSAIMENGFGKISYIVRDNTYSAPARHFEGNHVPQGKTVIICDIQRNVFYVTELDDNITSLSGKGTV